MRYLVQGMESKKKIELLLTITKITRENLVSALIDHFVHDFEQKDAAILNGVKQPNMVPAIKALNDAAEFGEKYHDLLSYDLSSIYKKGSISNKYVRCAFELEPYHLTSISYNSNT